MGGNIFLRWMKLTLWNVEICQGLLTSSGPGKLKGKNFLIIDMI